MLHEKAMTDEFESRMDAYSLSLFITFMGWFSFFLENTGNYFYVVVVLVGMGMDIFE